MFVSSLRDARADVQLTEGLRIGPMGLSLSVDDEDMLGD